MTCLRFFLPLLVVSLAPVASAQDFFTNKTTSIGVRYKTNTTNKSSEFDGFPPVDNVYRVATDNYSDQLSGLEGIQVVSEGYSLGSFTTIEAGAFVMANSYVYNGLTAYSQGRAYTQVAFTVPEECNVLIELATTVDWTPTLEGGTAQYEAASEFRLVNGLGATLLQVSDANSSSSIRLGAGQYIVSAETAAWSLAGAPRAQGVVESLAKVNLTATPVPEPGTMALIGAGLLAVARRRRS